ncbi:molybdenum cofactor biosynthesis protein MoaA [Rhizobium sp. Leaf371]|uniref:molybdopterin molybdotransferase MoeA n=1 Tax=Rhizobium sp. Leaf371 TaxID=1736355 RepID=UPI000714ACEA|nr:gephyrin-like molybdotransferase Glp [Rhizobium sp. Leaf371]KQS72959.1 molybdenum cofactor biosynthesis protein MoaA [Rhizobium sp. Leaf371]
MSLLPVETALERLLSAARPVTETETVAMGDAQGRVLARDVAARITHPPFDSSAMDGYALRSDDISKVGSIVTVIGESAAGNRFTGTVLSGQAVRIFTGAPVPDGADTVLIQEDAERLDGNRIRTGFVPAKGRHIRPKGQDFRQGDVVLHAGERLDAGRLTVAAGMNYDSLEVYRRVRVAILATGDELLPPGSSTIGPDQIIASNTLGIAAIARENGAEIIDLGIAPDRRSSIEERLTAAQTAGANILVTLGGASVGDHDLVQSTLVGAGMELDFWRIAMRPGKPLMVGRLGDMQVLGLPGNPVSSLVCGLLFLEPLVLALGHLQRRDRLASAITAGALPANDKRQDYIRAKLDRLPDGRLSATAFERQDSSMMQTFAQSDALIVRAPAAPEAEAGSPCTILLLR